MHACVSPVGLAGQVDLPACPVCCPPQVAAGAEVILTQPPLDWAAFERWMEDAQHRKLHTVARLLVGFPLLSSAGNVSFWTALCGAGSNQQVRQQHKHNRVTNNLCARGCSMS